MPDVLVVLQTLDQEVPVRQFLEVRYHAQDGNVVLDGCRDVMLGGLVVFRERHNAEDEL